MKYHYRTKPYPHQHKATVFLLGNGGGGLQVPMRWGKTKVGVDYAGATHLLRKRDGDKQRFPTKVLVITVTDGIEVWYNEIAKHCAVPWMATTGDPAPKSGGYGAPVPEFTSFEPLLDLEREYVATNDGLWWRVINWQNTYKRERLTSNSGWVPTDREDLFAWRPHIVIVDESHHAGNPTADQSRHAYRLCQHAKHVVIMTGSMFHRRPEYVFGQIKLYDEGIFGGNWGHFKRRVCIYGGYGGYEIRRYKNLKWMINKLKPVVFMEKYVAPREPVINVIPAQLTGRNRDVYRKMESQSIVQLGEGTARADIVLTRHLRLQQIAGGWLRTEHTVTGAKQLYRVGKCKLAIAASRLHEYHEQDITKAVIGCRFIPELVDLAKLAKRLGFRPILFHGRLPKGPKRAARIKDFQETTDPCLFIAQIRAASQSIDLSAASVMMLYSLSESYIDYDQFTSRIEKFKDTRTLMYDHIIATGTRDEVTWEAMREKKDVADYIAEDPERVERIVAANVDRKLAKKERAHAG